MPKRRFRSRRQLRRRPRVRRSFGKLKKFIKRTVNRMSEVKYVTTSAGFNNDANTAYIVQLNPQFPQGVGKNQRIGNKLQYKCFTLKFWVQLGDLGAAPDYNSHFVRVLIIQQRVAFTVPISLVDILDDAAQWQSTVRGTSVRVMYDKTFTLGLSNVALTHPFNTAKISLNKHFRTKNFVTFKSEFVTLPTDFKDTYYMLLLSDQLAAGGGVYAMQGNWFVRQSFIDV